MTKFIVKDTQEIYKWVLRLLLFSHTDLRLWSYRWETNKQKEKKYCNSMQLSIAHSNISPGSNDEWGRRHRTYSIC